MSIRFMWTTLVGLGALWLAPAAAQAQSTWYTLENVDTGLCVDVPGFSQQNTWVQQYPCNGGNNQYWRLVPSQWSGWYSIENLSSRKCLDLPGGVGDNGVNIQQYTCHGGYNQLWYKWSHGNGGFSLISCERSSRPISTVAAEPARV
ncbi:MAG: RICIN domain-containing protein [Myxococcales bacterium]|nr:RICIN domain-containing protein [Myxococcales bacterium]